MVDATIEAKLSIYLNRISKEQQLQVLEFARTLAVLSPKGVPGANLLKFAGIIDKSDLDSMEQAIKDGCEQVDANEW